MDGTGKANIFIQFIKSFYSFKDYPGFSKSKGGKVFLYILLMVLVTYIFTFVIPLYRAFSDFPKLDESLINDYVPYFEIKDGEFYIAEDFYYADEDGTVLLIAVSDPFESSEIDTKIINEYDQAIILTQDIIIMKQSASVVNEYDYSQISDFSRDDLYDIIPMIKVFIIIFYILAFLIYIVSFMIGTLVCSLIGVIINSLIKAQADYASIFKLTVYARTFPIIIKTLLSFLFKFSIPFAAFYILFGLYIFMALRAVKDDNEQNYPGGDGEFIYPGNISN